MKTSAKKLLALLMVCALFVLPVISCGSGDSGGSGDGGNDTSGGSSGDTGTDSEKLSPNLPDKKFDGYTFTFLSDELGPGDFNWTSPLPREIVPEEGAVNEISEAVTKRNAYIEETYDIKIELKGSPDPANDLTKAAQSNEDIYDATLIWNGSLPGIIQRGEFLRTDYLTYVDLSKPWWDPAVNAMSIAGKNFLMGGDILLLDNEVTNVILFNKNLLETNNIPLPYSLVKSGGWTLDKLNEYVSMGYKNLEGTGEVNWETDQFGLLVYMDSLHAFLVSGGGAVALKDKDDIPYMTLTTDRSLKVLDKVFDVMYNPATLNIQIDVTPMTSCEKAHVGTFEEGRALFSWVRMNIVERLRNMDDEFGIVPLPKYEENQEKYISLVNPWSGVLLGVPKIAGNPERTSIILEAMAAESRYTLRPAYYDVTLKRKNTRDNDSEAMLDIIFNSRAYDIGATYEFGGMVGDFVRMTSTKDRNIISRYEAKADVIQADINKVVDIFKKLD